MLAYIDIKFYDERVGCYRNHKSVSVDFEKSLELECGKKYIFGENTCVLKKSTIDIAEKVHFMEAVAITPVKEEMNEIIEVI